MVGRARSVALALLPLAALVAGCDLLDWMDHPYGPGGKKGHHVKVALAAVPPSQAGPPKTVTFNGIITVDKAMAVTYTFVHSDGSPTTPKTVNIPAPGPCAVSEKRTFLAPVAGWGKLKVISPGTVESLPAKYEVLP